MTLARYFVFQQDDTWIVGFEGRVMAHFATKTAALDSARGMANLMGAMHYDADVMVEDGGPLQQVWVVWTGQADLARPAPPPNASRDSQSCRAITASRSGRARPRGQAARAGSSKLHQLRLPARPGLGEHALQLRADGQHALSASRWRSPRPFRRR